MGEIRSPRRSISRLGLRSADPDPVGVGVGPQNLLFFPGNILEADADGCVGAVHNDPLDRERAFVGVQ